MNELFIPVFAGIFQPMVVDNSLVVFNKDSLLAAEVALFKKITSVGSIKSNSH